ncbi:MAG: hypothetical protein SOT68_08665 [Oscillospiraceae bacterium]|nr:hypothetical protein [Oscillospiraceae bacterium]
MAIRNIEKHIRLSKKEDDILKKKAAKDKVSVCEYIRRTAVNGKILRYDILSLHDNLISFRMVGTELNAIAKEINTHRTISINNINALNTQLDFLESYTEKFCIPIPEIVGEGENP